MAAIGKQKVAEGVGFEPTEGVNPRRFSRPVHSTALPPLRAKTRFVSKLCRSERALSNTSPYVCLDPNVKEFPNLVKQRYKLRHDVRAQQNIVVFSQSDGCVWSLGCGFQWIGCF